MERPYRIYNAQTKEFLRWRYFVFPKNAHIGALIECRWAKVGVTLEVINHNNGKMLGQYTRGVNAVSFRGEKNEYAGKPAKRNNVHALHRRKETVDKETGEVRRSA